MTQKTTSSTLSKTRVEQALEYHKGEMTPAGSGRSRAGKIEVVASKSLISQRDLEMAYTPGVAEPCKAIAKDPEAAYLYTAKSNLVGVVTNGTAVLGLGNIGPLAGKPVMEGKAVLFKKLADIDCFDIEVEDKLNVDLFCDTVVALEPTFGGINLEDIRAPECFEIEKRLRERMNIPVFHDDQHGTAIISGAALLNALEITKKKIQDIKVVFCGGGAASISCARFWLSLGVRRENCVMTDRLGVIFEERSDSDMNDYKREFSVKAGGSWHKNSPKTLSDAMVGADVFMGCSVGNVVTAEMIASMADHPIVFAMANPEPEIDYETAKAARSDMIFATGRSDYPNQVNNVLGYPFIFRGALDVRARSITEEMKVAAAKAIAQLAKQEVPEHVVQIYGGKHLSFGVDYILPKPFDPRVLLFVAPAVAEAAIKSGVATRELPGGSVSAYRARLEKLQSKGQSVMRDLKDRIRKEDTQPTQSTEPIRMVFPEATNEKILKAASILRSEGICEPILLGNDEEILSTISKFNLDELDGVEIIRPSRSALLKEFTDLFWQMRKRKGATPALSQQLMKDPLYFGAMLLRTGRADAWLAGVTRSYPDTLRPALQVVGAKGGGRVAGLHMMVWKDRVVFLADTTVNVSPSAEDLADIAISTSNMAESFGFEPRVAMLSFSNFGSNSSPEARVVQEAVQIIQRRRPDILVDGEMQADTAVNPKIISERFPFCKLADKGGANVLVFPNLAASNICYKLLAELGGAEAIGPILMGMNQSVHVMQMTCEVQDIVNVGIVATLEAQRQKNQLLDKGLSSVGREI